MGLIDKVFNERYTYNVFVNSPNKNSNITILHEKKFSSDIPFFSIIVPIYNEDYIIVDNIKSIINCTTEKHFELILILDACSDKTEININEWIKNINIEKYKLLTNILILNSSIPLFETAADNIGFFYSRGKYCLELRANMKMIENGYNMKMLKPFILDDNIIGISGRCCSDFSGENGIGKLGWNILLDTKDIPNISSNSYYIAETCYRGPLLFDKLKLRQLGYLDEVNYFMENDVHDLFARAYVEKKWKCGYVPIDFNSLKEYGIKRKKRDELNKEYYEKYLVETKNSINAFLQKNINKIPHRDIVKKSLYLYI